MAIPSWLHISPTSGDRNGSFTVQADSHTGRLSRSATITGTTGHGTTKTMNITQSAAEETIVITKVYVDNESISSGTQGVYSVNLTAKNSSKVLVYIKTNSEAISLYTKDTNLVPNICRITLYKVTSLTPNEKGLPDGTKLIWNPKTKAYSDCVITGDPGAGATTDFCVMFDEFRENKTTSSNLFENIIFANGGYPNSSTTPTVSSLEKVTISQAAGTKTYSTPVIKSFSYADVPAGGSDKMANPLPIISAEQTWGWNGNTVNGGTLTSGFTYLYGFGFDDQGGSFEGAIDSNTGKVSLIDSLGSNVKDRTLLTTVRVTVSANGKSGYATASLYQEANVATYTAPKFNIKEASPINFTSAKSSKLIFAGLINSIDYSVSYTSGDSDTLYLDIPRGITSGAIKITEKTAVDGFSISGSSMLTAVRVTENYGGTARNGYQITITATAQGKTASITYTFNQAAGGSTIVFNPTSLTFATGGSTQTVTVTSNDTWTIS